MRVTPGARIGPYDVIGPIGAGGMGEVFRARDTRLGRDVALKVLPEDVSQDKDRLARFRREAQLLASLNHPNVASIHGLEEQPDVLALVLELVEGEDLAVRLQRGPIPVGEAIAIALQIAEALEEAHEKGIVHRDLKPANVKVTADGKVKVLDFGLAKALSTEPPSTASELSASPTLTARASAAGHILGTAAYMAPEQARGKPVDRRTDVWAFGVVLFEMLSGRRAFDGETVSDVIAAVLKAEPPMDALPADVPPRVRRLIERCLRKDPRQRLHDIADARLELAEGEVAAAPSALPARRTTWIVAALAAVVAAALAVAFTQPAAEAPRTLKLAVVPPPDVVASGMFDLSADGGAVVFRGAGRDGITRLYHRSLDALDARVLPGTEGASNPFFSRDGRSVAFFASRMLRRVDLAGGPARDLADAPDPRGGSWGADNVIVFAGQGGGALSQVSASGGAVTAATTLDTTRQEVSHRWPRFLPDGRRFVFMSRRPQSRLTLEVAAVGDGARTPLFESSSPASYARGYLYFVRNTSMLAQRFNPDSLEASGDPMPVTEGVWRDTGVDGLVAFAVAEDGTLAWRRGEQRTELTWLARDGQRLGTLGPVSTTWGNVSLSRDERRVVAEFNDPASSLATSLVLDAATGMTTRVAPRTPANQTSAVIGPDGRTVVFAADTRGAFDLYRQEVGSSGEPTLLLANGAWKYPEAVSPDGAWVVFSQTTERAGRDLWVMPMTGGSTPTPFTQTDADEWGATFSPDGRFVTYVSDESGRSEVFVRAFPESPAKRQVSTAGGESPYWRGDGREIVYRAPDDRLMAVSMSIAGGELEVGTPQPISGPLPMLGAGPGTSHTFAVTADGQRILANLEVGQVEASPIVVVTGGLPER